MKKLLYITLGLTLACFVSTSASAQTPAGEQKEVKKVTEIKKKEATPQAVDGSKEVVAPKTKVRTRAISIDEEGIEEANPKKSTTTTAPTTPKTKKAKVVPKKD